MSTSDTSTLTQQQVREATGVDDLDEVTELEIIFTETADLSVLKQVPNLTCLTLISTNLPYLTPFHGPLLQSLTLVNQNISRMENLVFPNLKELFLQHNRIEKIEGLENCPKLQRLWLCGNRISSIENLHPCGDLRELWLQDNKIDKISSLECLPNLKDLQLSANPISTFKEVQSLSPLSCLRMVGFAEKSYHPCPVALNEGYRSFIICALKQVRMVDGYALDASDRKQAEDQYLEKVLAFNDKIDQIRRENEVELVNVERRRRKLANEAFDIQEKLMESFKTLEDVVQGGRTRIKNVHEHQIRVRDTNLNQLTKSLHQVQDKYNRHIEQLIAKEQQQEQEEELIFAQIERLAKLEMDESLAQCELQRDSHSPVVFQLLKGDGANAQSLSDELKNVTCVVQHGQREYQKEASEGEPSCQWEILFAAKVFNARLYNTHKAHLNDALLGADEAKANRNFVTYFPQEYFVALADLDAAKSWLRDGANEPIVILSDSLAVANSLLLGNLPRGVLSYESCMDHECEFHRFAICNVARTNVASDVHSMKLKWSDIRDVGTLRNLFAKKPANAKSIQITIGSHPATDGGLPDCSIVITSPTSVVTNNYVVLNHTSTCNNNPASGTSVDELVQRVLAQSPGQVGQLSQIWQDPAQSGTSIEHVITRSDKKYLESLENAVAKYVSDYEQRVLQELDPDTDQELKHTNTEVQQLKQKLRDLREEIDQEKANQEQLLREFKATRATGSNNNRRQSSGALR